MTEPRVHANGQLLDLRTVLPDGREVFTRWPADRRFVSSAQQEHAATHLRRVYAALAWPAVALDGEGAV